MSPLSTSFFFFLSNSTNWFLLVPTCTYHFSPTAPTTSTMMGGSTEGPDVWGWRRRPRKVNDPQPQRQQVGLAGSMKGFGV